VQEWKETGTNGKVRWPTQVLPGRNNGRRRGTFLAISGVLGCRGQRRVEPILCGQQARKLFDELFESEDRAMLLLLTQLLARLVEATNR